MRTRCGVCGSNDIAPRLGDCRRCRREAKRRRRAGQSLIERTRKFPPRDFVCEKCGKTIVIEGPRTRRYCSITCAYAARRNTRNSNWKGGTSNANGYNWVRLPYEDRELHTCVVRNGHYIPVHRLKAEKILGRCLRKGECVHHINGNKMDNRNCNLLICDNKYHMYLHIEMGRRWQREHFGTGVTGAI